MPNFLRGHMGLVDASTLSFAAGTRQPLQIPVPATYLKKLWINLRGTLTISAVTVPGTIHRDGPVNLVRNIELLIDGYPLKVGRLAHFFRIAQRYDATQAVNNGLFTGAAGVYDFQAVVPLFFESPASVGPFDTIEDGRTIRNMFLYLTWGDTGDLVVGNTSTLALTNTTAEVYVEDTEPNFDRSGQPYRLRETDTTQANVGTSASTRMPIPFTEGGVIRSILLKAVDNTNLSDAVINTLVALRVNGGEEEPLKNLEDDFLQALTLYEAGGLSALVEGYYHLETCERGRPLTTGLGAGGGKPLNSLDLVLDTTVGGTSAAATSIIAHVMELVPANR